MKKKSLVVAIGAGMMVGMASMAQADSILFPYFKSGGGAFSLVTMFNAAGTGGFPIDWAPSTNSLLHYTWMYRNQGANGTLGTGACAHSDLWGTMTQMDLVLQEVTNRINAPSLLGDKSNVKYLQYTANPSEGFMIVSNHDAADVGQNEDTLFGSMMIVDTTTADDFTWSYNALNNPAVHTKAFDGDFSSAWTSYTSFDMTWYPTAYVDTKWRMTVTGSNMLVGPYAEWGTLVNGFSLGGGYGLVWNNDEVPMSGGATGSVTCMGDVALSALLDPAQTTHAANGGYMWTVWVNGLGAPGKNTGTIWIMIVEVAGRV